MKASGIKRTHWYRTHIDECPVCGHVDEYRERVYGDKPEKASDRYEHSQVYDQCLDS